MAQWYMFFRSVGSFGFQFWNWGPYLWVFSLLLGHWVLFLGFTAALPLTFLLLSYLFLLPLLSPLIFVVHFSLVSRLMSSMAPVRCLPYLFISPVLSFLYVMLVLDLHLLRSQLLFFYNLIFRMEP